MILSVAEILNSRFDKDRLVSRINTFEEDFNETLQIALSPANRIAWRAAWVIQHSIKKEDLRIAPFQKELILCIENGTDGHQRELLKIIENINVDENNEGLLLDQCIKLWKDVSKTPSVRIVAFRIIVRIMNKYPELAEEMEFLIQPEYINHLSPGIKNSCMKQIVKMKKRKTNP